ncbi:hypothetical protein ATO13_22291 [Stappia sp. 22II-S9-Z10]|nr:hypothetical protein ATO13_22291 [Stappia sp. 22II-S9-Z10]
MSDIAKRFREYGTQIDRSFGPRFGDKFREAAAEIERLRGLVRGAFVEGWQAGFGVGASEDPLSENPDLDAWGDSRTRLALAEAAPAQRDGDYGTPEGTR